MVVLAPNAARDHQLALRKIRRKTSLKARAGHQMRR